MLTHWIFSEVMTVLAALSALFSVLLAAVILRRDPRRFENQAFFAMVALMALLHMDNAPLVSGAGAGGAIDPFASRSVYLACFNMYALVLFARAFPLNRHPEPLVIIGHGLLTLLPLYLVQVDSDGIAASRYSWYARSYFLISCGLFTVFVFDNYRKLRTDYERHGLLLVFAAIACRFALVALVFATTRMLGRPPTFLLVSYLVITPPALVLIMAYGMLRFQMASIRSYLAQSLAYFFVVVAAILAFFLANSTLHPVLTPLVRSAWAEGFSQPVVLLVLMIVFHPIQKKLESLLDRWLDPGLVNARTDVQTFITASGTMLEPRLLFRALMDLTRAILPDSKMAVVMMSSPPQLQTFDGLIHFLNRPPAALGVRTTARRTGPHERPCPASESSKLTSVEIVVVPELSALESFFSETRLEYYVRSNPSYHRPETLPSLGDFKYDLLVPFWKDGEVQGVIALIAPEIPPDRIPILTDLVRPLGLQLENASLYQQAIDANRALTDANKVLEDTRLFLERLFESVPVGVGVLNHQAKVVRWNKAMEDLTGISRDQAAASTDISQLLPDIGFDAAASETRQRRTVPIRRRLFLRARHEEVVVNIRLAMFKDRDGSFGGVVLILTDVSEQIRMQDALEESKRLAVLGQFAAAMAHELRTPLTSIQMNVQILSGKLDLPAEDAEYFDIMLTELDRLNRTIAEVLDFAKPMRLNKSDIDITELLEEVVRALYFLLAERGVEVAVEIPVPVVLYADVERLKQVLIILLDNASQAVEARTRQESADPDLIEEIRVMGTHYPSDSGDAGILVCVRDQGKGIERDVISRIFEPFFTTREKGTGLGLAIAKKIAEAHRGTLTVESVPGRGSNFRLWLPLRAQEPLSPTKSSPVDLKAFTE